MADEESPLQGKLTIAPSARHLARREDFQQFARNHGIPLRGMWVERVPLAEIPESMRKLGCSEVLSGVTYGEKSYKTRFYYAFDGVSPGVFESGDMSLLTEERTRPGGIYRAAKGVRQAWDETTLLSRISDYTRSFESLAAD